MEAMVNRILAYLNKKATPLDVLIWFVLSALAAAVLIRF